MAGFGTDGSIAIRQNVPERRLSIESFRCIILPETRFTAGSHSIISMAGGKCLVDGVELHHRFIFQETSIQVDFRTKIATKAKTLVFMYFSELYYHIECGAAQGQPCTVFEPSGTFSPNCPSLSSIGNPMDE